ncbi:MAG TPA: radical SAM protein [bacterium]|nr:radical SAM protein [bacterium]HOL47680.1 radical SAM protein [bacterium]HPQ18704.1 radical SAM protein [bacterium]
MKKLSNREIIKKYFANCLPYEVIIELTEDCNLSCVHCNRVKGKKFISIDEYKFILNELKKLGTYRVFFTGGEPTINPDFLDIIDLTIKEKFFFSIQTNGTNITNELIKKLKPTKFFSSMQISLYGSNEKIYRKVTQQKNFFKKVINNIEKCKNAGFKIILKSLISKLNYDDIENLEKLGKKFNVFHKFDFTIFPRDDGNLDYQNLRVSFDDLIKYQLRLYSNYTKEEIIKSLKSNRHLKKYLNTNICNAGITKMCITANGELLSCNAFRKSFGNIFKYGLINLWKNSDELNQLRKLKLKNFKKCVNCNLLKYCNSKCIGLFYAENNSIFIPSEFRCTLQALYLDIIKKHYII